MSRNPIAATFLIIALATFFNPAQATVWIITGGNLTTWFTNGIGGSSLQPVYEQGFGTNAEAPSPRASGYNCFGLSAPNDTSCEIDETGEGIQAGIWGSAAVYSGLIDDGGTPGDLSNYTGTISWTGESGSAAAAGSELFTTSIASGAYDVATGIASTSVGSVTGNGGGLNCWNNPDTVAVYGANFCGNTTGGATLTTSPSQTIATRYLPDGVFGFTDNMNGTINIILADTTFSSCMAANPATCGSASSDTFAVWTLNATPVPVPAALWLFGSALGVLGWLRGRQ